MAPAVYRDGHHEAEEDGMSVLGHLVAVLSLARSVGALTERLHLSERERGALAAELSEQRRLYHGLEWHWRKTMDELTEAKEELKQLRKERS
jgi:hypothetical protein